MKKFKKVEKTVLTLKNSAPITRSTTRAARRWRQRVRPFVSHREPLYATLDTAEATSGKPDDHLCDQIFDN